MVRSYTFRHVTQHTAGAVKSDCVARRDSNPTPFLLFNRNDPHLEFRLDITHSPESARSVNYNPKRLILNILSITHLPQDPKLQFQAFAIK